MNKRIITIFSSLLFFLILTPRALAHVVVTPASAGVASTQTFTVSVPNEKDTSVISLILDLPRGLQDVTPNAKPGWTIEVTKSGDFATKITWIQGEIPIGQRDQFLFSAQVPPAAGTLQWKAYQTYADGTTVSWDQKPDPKMSDAKREELEQQGKGPYSQTRIINDLTGSPQTKSQTVLGSQTKEADQAFTLSLLAIVIALSSFVLQVRREIDYQAKRLPRKKSR
jgi:uncharacterized protein YcnI